MERQENENRDSSASGKRSATDAVPPQEAPELERLVSESRAAREDAQLLLEDLGSVLTTASGLARAQLLRNPYGTLLAAAGAGYVLGGGLPTRILGLAASLGLRQVGTRAALGMIDRLQEGMTDPAADGP